MHGGEGSAIARQGISKHNALLPEMAWLDLALIFPKCREVTTSSFNRNEELRKLKGPWFNNALKQSAITVQLILPGFHASGCGVYHMWHTADDSNHLAMCS
ncbi:Hypothetical predicted protein [Podarcis lilfordi]|uniref:Uncharacterized protein n=1 Tax=Podarcis lilfordi TaxID=74358 RepID=A0AA35KWA0_9SAUR|nr:Hypothetical predicted protein [Podarcis lilfordi]